MKCQHLSKIAWAYNIISSKYNGEDENRPGAHFSKVPVTFQARNQLFKLKYKE